MVRKKTVTKHVAAKKKVAGPGKSTGRKKVLKKAVPKKKVALKKVAGKVVPKKKAVAKKPAKKVVPKKKAVAKKMAKKAMPTKKGAAKKTAKKAVEETPQAPVVARKRPAKKRVAPINDALTPRTEKRPTKKLKVIRPGRKKSQRAISKPKIYRPLTAKQKNRYCELLMEMRDRVSGQISSLKKDSLTRVDEVNVEEDGTDAFDRQFALTLASSENDSLVKIDAALTRVQEGSFGQCQECGGGIESARLKAIPFARNCIACQSELEKNEPGYHPALHLD